jgi:hypothetical protein
MMKKKISILSLVILFLVSTTGLPIYSHYCEMMEKMSSSECEVCMIEMQKVETSCCSEEMNEELLTISAENPVCCQEEFVYNKVEDELLFNKTEITFFLSSENSVQPLTLIPPTFEFSSEESFYCDSSPPFLINPEIHITNSVLLI